MKITNTLLTLILASSLFLCGCMSTNPNTGQKEYDSVKTEKVKAAVKPAIATAVLLAIKQEPKAAQGFILAQAVVCDLASRQNVNPETVNNALLMVAIPKDWNADAKMGFQVGINTILGIYNVALADKLRADISEDLYASTILQTLCDGFGMGLMQAKDAGLIQ